MDMAAQDHGTEVQPSRINVAAQEHGAEVPPDRTNMAAHVRDIARQVNTPQGATGGSLALVSTEDGKTAPSPSGCYITCSGESRTHRPALVPRHADMVRTQDLPALADGSRQADVVGSYLTAMDADLHTPGPAFQGRLGQRPWTQVCPAT